MALILRKLQQKDEAAFLRAIDRTKVSDPNFTFYYAPDIRFSDYVHGLDEKERGIGLPEGHDPGTLLFGFVGEEIVGRLSIRHQLNDFLLRQAVPIARVLDRIEESRRRR